MRVALFARLQHVWACDVLTHLTLFEAIISQVVIDMNLTVHQVFQLAFSQLGCRMSPVQRLHLFPCTHIKEALIELSNLARRQVHVFVMSQDVIERFFLHELDRS